MIAAVVKDGRLFDATAEVNTTGLIVRRHFARDATGADDRKCS